MGMLDLKKKALIVTGVAVVAIIIFFQPTKTVVVFKKVPFIGTTMQNVTGLQFIPNTNELLVLSKSGRVVHYSLEETRARKMGEFRVPNLTTENGCGAFAIGLAPDFVSSKKIFILHCSKKQLLVLSSFTFSQQYSSIQKTEKNILEFPDANSGGIMNMVSNFVWDKEGGLIFGLGDRNIIGASQDSKSLLGKILRVHPSTLGILPSAQKKEQVTILAKGLQRPWRLEADKKGDIWIAENGTSKEEINILAGSGANFGWGLETICTDDIKCDFRTPQISWDRLTDVDYMQKSGASDNNSLIRTPWVGPEYRAEMNRYEDLLYETVIYGDWCVGWINAIKKNDSGVIISNKTIGNLPMISATTVGPDGYLYAATYSDVLPNSCYAADERPSTTTVGDGSLWRIELR